MKSRGRVLVAGLLSSPNGIGEGGRLIRSGLEACGYDIASFDLSPIIQPNLSTIKEGPSEVDDETGPLILHVNPTEVPKALFSLKDRNLKNRRLIGVWAWELERPPKFWNFCAKWFDEIWAISDFTAGSLSDLSTPVTHVGYPIETTLANSDVDWRKKLNLETNFIVLTAFDTRSSLVRKNPYAAIEAFKKAFHDIPNAALVVKASGPIGVQDREVFSKKSVVLIEEAMSPADMNTLILAADCHISLSRAEGLGLVAAQAAANGIPVIVTGWSGPSEWESCPNVYLVDYSLTPIKDATNIYSHASDLRWAEPNIEDAAEKLRHVFEQHENIRVKLAVQARVWWSENYSTAAFEARIPKLTLECLRKTVP